MSALRHQALLYDGPDDFVAAGLPFVRDGIAAGQPVLAVARRENVDALREALGDDAGRAELRESSRWYVSPGRAFAGFLDFALVNADAPGVRMIGEPIWPAGWQAGVREYAHYESVFNVVAADAPIFALCPYDVRSLPDEILEHARATHPEVRSNGRAHPNSHYVDPDTYCSRLADRFAAPGAQVRTFPITSDLATLRRGVEAEAKAAGVQAARLPEFLLALHELAANALSHADRPAAARAWREGRTFVCEVESWGEELSETTAGYLPPDPDAERARGLWLVRQLCDLVEVRSRGGLTAIRIHVGRA